MGAPKLWLVLLLVMVPFLMNYNRFSNVDLLSLNSVSRNTIEWINDHPLNQSSRMVVEQSDLPTGQIWGGLAPSFFPYYTDEYFISEFGDMYWIARNSNFHNGFAFNKPIEEYSIEEFTKKLQDYNIKYLAVFSDSVKSFLNSNSEYFELLETFDQVNIYNYTDSVDTYIITDNPLITTKLDVFNNINIKLRLYNTAIGDTIQISVNYVPNWEIYANGTRLQQNSGSSLINFTINESGNYNITLIWNHRPLNIVSFYISFSTIVVLVMILFQKARNQRKYDRGIIK